MFAVAQISRVSFVSANVLCKGFPSLATVPDMPLILRLLVGWTSLMETVLREDSQGAHCSCRPQIVEHHAHSLQRAYHCEKLIRLP